MRPTILAWLSTIVMVLTLPSLAHSQIAPQQFRGRSIIFSWTELREQRWLGETNWRTVRDGDTLRIYFGATGRPFFRFSSSLGHKSFEAVGAASAPQLDFADRRLIAHQYNNLGRVRRFEASFNESYSTCDLQIISAKPPGASTVLGTDIDFPSKRFEISSVTISQVSCSVRDGNVFAQ